jgi:hypothetical protein
MTAASPGDPLPGDLTARVFRALYPGYDLHAVAGTYLAVPAGTPCFTAPAISGIARQISDHGQPCAAAPAPPDLTDRPAREPGH